MKRLEEKISVLGVLLFALAASSLPSRVMAQGSDTALLRGTVTDSSGAVVPRATVTMTNVATGVSEKRPTDEAGRYLFTDLKTAVHRAEVEATGFKTLVRDTIAVRDRQQTDPD